MTLRFTPDRGFTQECTAADGETFHATFLILPDEEIGDFDLATRDGEIAFLKNVVRNIEGFEGASGAPIPFTDELRDQALGFADIRMALLRGYRNGILSAKAGN